MEILCGTMASQKNVNLVALDNCYSKYNVDVFKDFQWVIQRITNKFSDAGLRRSDLLKTTSRLQIFLSTEYASHLTEKEYENVVASHSFSFLLDSELGQAFKPLDETKKEKFCEDCDLSAILNEKLNFAIKEAEDSELMEGPDSAKELQEFVAGLFEKLRIFVGHIVRK